MTSSNIASLRLRHQQIAGTTFTTAKQTVHWMGAMQAQDFAMAKWAIGVRLPEATQKTIDEAVAKGEIIRTHALRPTWHFLASEDVRWIIELTAPRIKAVLRTRHQRLELTGAVIAKSNAIMEKVLAGGHHMTRSELVRRLEQHHIRANDQRAAHLLMHAELDGIICSGAPHGREHTYALFDERVGKGRVLLKDEALSELAMRYFASHGPATLQDFVWWSGLTISEARHGLGMVESRINSEKVKKETYWWMKSADARKPLRTSVFLLPAYDEYIISYKDRTSVLAEAHHKKAMSNNGIFWPLIVVDGIVAGTWSRKIEKEKLLLETELFSPVEKGTTLMISKRFEGFREFVGAKVVSRA